MNEKWIPPEDMEDIPLEVLAQIPKKYHYWLAEEPELLRVQLAEAIEKDEVVIEIVVELSVEELQRVYLKKKIELVELMTKRWSV